MHKVLFMRVVDGVSSIYEYIRQPRDARGMLDFDLIQKYTFVFCMLGYATP